MVLTMTPFFVICYHFATINFKMADFWIKKLSRYGTNITAFSTTQKY